MVVGEGVDSRIASLDLDLFASFLTDSGFEHASLTDALCGTTMGCVCTSPARYHVAEPGEVDAWSSDVDKSDDALKARVLWPDHPMAQMELAARQQTPPDWRAMAQETQAEHERRCSQEHDIGGGAPSTKMAVTQRIEAANRKQQRKASGLQKQVSGLTLKG